MLRRVSCFFAGGRRYSAAHTLPRHYWRIIPNKYELNMKKKRVIQALDSNKDDIIEVDKYKPYVVPGILAMNTMIYGLWQIPMFESFMYNHFTCSLAHLQTFKIYTLFTSTFSHQSVLHLLCNNYGMFQLCPQILDKMTSIQFLKLYSSAGICSFGTCIFLNQMLGLPDTLTLGASGALSAVVFILFNDESIRISFFHGQSTPIPGRLLLALLIGLDLGLLLNADPNHGSFIAHGAHLGGFALGAVYSIT